MVNQVTHAEASHSERAGENVMEREQRKAGVGACQEISPGVYYMEVGKGFDRSNVYFVRSGSSWVLIDAASPNFGRLIQKSAESVFGAGTRPASILLTHDHPDHAGSARELAGLWNCPVYVHPGDLPLATIDDIATVDQYANPIDRWIVLPLLRMMPRQRVEAMFAESNLKDVVQTFDPGGAVPNLPDWECIPAPGHTAGHVAFFRASDRVLIAGDAVLTVDLNSVWGTLLWALRLNRPRVSGPPWYSTWNWQTAKESVTVLARHDPCVLASGHGAPLSGGEIARELRAFADHFSGPAAGARVTGLRPGSDLPGSLDTSDESKRNQYSK
jgi:glyoxylase-like metal-dependent hydrolase (beta-lactamase superfamily II)